MRRFIFNVLPVALLAIGGHALAIDVGDIANGWTKSGPDGYEMQGKNGGILVVVITSRLSKFVTQVRNNQPIAKYRNEAVQLFLVSATLLSKIGNNINNIDFYKEHAGLTAVPIEALSEQFTVNENNPISAREIIYTFK